MPDQTLPGGSSRFVADQEVFCLQHLIGASRSEGGHTFLRRDTNWDCNALKLWLNPLSSKGWYWNNGCQLQMARKAAEIPFDQRLLAQDGTSGRQHWLRFCQRAMAPLSLM